MSYWSTRAQKLWNHLRSSVPRFLFQKGNPLDDGTFAELWAAYVRMFDNIQAQIDYWFTQTYIKQSNDIWLTQHAIDRGSNRQSGETDVALISRLSNVEDVVTRPALLARIQAVMTAFGAAGAPQMVELRSSVDRVFASTPGYLISTGFAIAYYGRGFRLSASDATSGFIVVLPFGTSNAVRDAVIEYIRRVKGAGIYSSVEVRGVP